MKTHYFVIVTVFFLCFMPLNATPTPQITADGAILIEPKTNTILFEKNGFNRFYPASTTKILTSLILLEEMEPDTILCKTKNAVQAVPSDSSHIGLCINDTFSSKDALYGILLGSDNFIAHDMAIKNAGSISAFSQKMNVKAKALGALHSHFVNPHGYHDSNHYTTPYDLAQIAKSAFNIEKLTQIAGTPTYSFKVLNKNKTLFIKNTSRLLKKETPYYNPHVVACKTGFHDDAKQTIVAKACYNNIELIAVVMKTNTPNQYKDINALFNYGQKNFSTVKLADNTYSLQNHTSSAWSKSAIEDALNKNWLPNPPMNYGSKIPANDFIILLTQAVKPYSTCDTTNTLAPFASTSPLTKRRLAEILFTLHTTLKPETCPSLVQASLLQAPIPDIETLPQETQDAIHFVVDSKLLGETEKPFLPTYTLSYEEAICIASRFEKLLNVQ